MEASKTKIKVYSGYAKVVSKNVECKQPKVLIGGFEMN